METKEKTQKQKMSKLQKLALGFGVAGFVALGSIPTGTKTFEGELKNIDPVRGSGAYYCFDKDTISGVYNMEKGQSYEVKVDERLFWPDNVSYKKQN
jgi:hypothetical protein